jgi:hypothetical protein
MRHGVGVVLEPDTGLADIVGDDQVEVLAGQLGLGVGQQIAVSAAKPTRICPAGLAAPEPGEDVGRGLEDDVGRPSSLLELAGATVAGTEVGYGRGHDHHVRLGRQPASHGRVHLRRSLHPLGGRHRRDAASSTWSPG